MPSQGQKFVIVGGAGLVGSALARTLVGMSSEDIIICDNFGDVSEQKWAHVPNKLADIWEPETLLPNLDKAWRDIAGVIVVADNGISHQDADLIFETAYHLPRRVWDFCVAKQRPIYWASSAHVYGAGPSSLSTDPEVITSFKPVNAFGRAKLAFDMFAARQGTGPQAPPIATGFRLASVYGAGETHKGASASLPTQALAHATTKTALHLWQGSAAATRDWVHVDDAASAMAEVIGAERAGFVDIGTGKSTRVDELMALIEDLTSIKLTCTFEATAPYPVTSLAAADISGLTTTFRSLRDGLASL